MVCFKEVHKTSILSSLYYVAIGSPVSRSVISFLTAYLKRCMLEAEFFFFQFPRMKEKTDGHFK